MNRAFKLFFVSFVLILGMESNAQEIVKHTLESEVSETKTTCGSFHYMEFLDGKSEGFMQHSDNFVLNLKKVIKHQNGQKSNQDLYRVPVVFHVVYNNEEENLPDSVIQNQLDVLNQSFRRTNADTINTRAEFLPYVGDSYIEFFLAETDPEGAPTNGINRISTDVEYFGGTLPYAANQVTEITEWVNDTFFDNLFSITRTDLGGVDPWDTERYLNIWAGDLRIFEPEIDNFEELVFFGLATPPADHYNWPQEQIEPFLDYNQGVLMHYVAVGGNNPNSYPAPYGIFNNSMRSGKITAHEVGHYLGLRHIWGDGACGFDDFIDDTPLANAGGLFDCNYSSNTCTDDIDGIDLPNMVENYMDYTSGACQNSFTNGQIAIMREVLAEYRPELAEIILSQNSINQSMIPSELRVYPNPMNEALNISFQLPSSSAVSFEIYDSMGRLVHEEEEMRLRMGKHAMSIDVSSLEHGVYNLSVITPSGKLVRTVIK